MPQLIFPSNESIELQAMPVPCTGASSEGDWRWPDVVLGINTQQFDWYPNLGLHAAIHMADFMFEHPQPWWSEELRWGVAAQLGLIPAGVKMNAAGLTNIFTEQRCLFEKVYFNAQLDLLYRIITNYIFRSVDEATELPNRLKLHHLRKLTPATCNNINLLCSLLNTELRTSSQYKRDWQAIDAQVISVYTGIKIDSYDNYIPSERSLYHRQGITHEQMEFNYAQLQQLAHDTILLIDDATADNPMFMRADKIKRISAMTSIMLRTIQRRTFHGWDGDPNSVEAYSPYRQQQQFDEIGYDLSQRNSEAQYFIRLGQLDPEIAIVVKDVRDWALAVDVDRRPMRAKYNDTIKTLLARFCTEVMCACYVKHPEEDND